ncbi:MAG TPA: alpha/beta hydrolase [Ktedonobacteraceae bacterium]|nr:alpha/beta hydrolase [Ktedonobacteraceae bacterium]
MPVSPVRDEYVIAGDLTFHYVQWGEQGSPVICVHGITANAYCFQALADELSSTHRVFAYDLRGRGDSDKPESGYSIPIHAEDLAAIIEALELDLPVVVGHSLGAMIGLYFAAHYPEHLSKLVLMDGGGHLPWNTLEEQPAWLTASIGRLGTPVPSFDEYVQRLKFAPFLGPYWNEYLDIYFAHDVFHQHDGTVISKGYPAGVFEDQMYIYEYKPETLWPRVQVPTLLQRAGQGLFTPDDQLLTEAEAETISRAIKRCRYVNYPDMNHYTIAFLARSGPAPDIQGFIKKEG